MAKWRITNVKKDNLAVKAVRSNWLPLDNLNGELPIPLSSRNLANLNIFFSPFVERKVDGIDYREITDVKRLLKGERVIYNQTYQLRPPENGSFIVNLMLLLAYDERSNKYALKLNPTKVTRFLERSEGESCCYTEVIELAKECGITDVSAANYMLRTLMMLGLVYKSKEGRKTYYTFASTSEHDLDLACCGILEHFNLTSTIKPLFSFDEWMQRYDIEVG
jgi:hypothetical protein